MHHSEIAKHLSEQPFFTGLSEDHLNWLARHAVETRFDVDQLVARQGDRADRFYLLLEGALGVEIPAIAGPKLEITQLGSGQIFGWSWLIRPYKWHFNARALEPTRVLDFDGKAILEHCEEDPEFGYALLKLFSYLMATRLESAQRKMMDQWAPDGLP
ncbi:cyclic nucleotide-binding domain-containing protein [Wenzhouxiangella sp. AB-CW3]|uniref:Crp/Fnr family transcriptional regulator n=1 Tax=Wenzhouxiangella sp. AB-CW3 TaxID=2771012 RepID=UPI00168B13D3|nr:cyclic nucleotide-binding domain-containing protein [Wenzhouxiangella sp. AB-CW3]QOC23890.1 cyclic nucleotide-binding domain-containing protein [Wenzhouxiangella sp. AB-CW3]